MAQRRLLAVRNAVVASHNDARELEGLVPKSVEGCE